MAAVVGSAGLMVLPPVIAATLDHSTVTLPGEPETMPTGVVASSSPLPGTFPPQQTLPGDDAPSMVIASVDHDGQSHTMLRTRPAPSAPYALPAMEGRIPPEGLRPRRRAGLPDMIDRVPPMFQAPVAEISPKPMRKSVAVWLPAPHGGSFRREAVDANNPSGPEQKSVVAWLQAPHDRYFQFHNLAIAGEQPRPVPAMLAVPAGPRIAAMPEVYIPWAERRSNAFKTGPVHGNPHLAPHLTQFSSTHKPGTIVVHVREKRLYLVETASTARVYPIGTARWNLDILGRTSITTRRSRPSWTPTPNQRRRDPTLPRRVEAGPDNPLGIRALGLGWRYRLIHGTSDPSSIGFARSDGCIRMLNDDVADLFDRVRVGNRVLVLASANADLVETRPPGYQEYRPRKRRWRKRRGSKRKYRAERRYASRKKRRRRR
ncbi:MAG: L,D-transpeptidase family protein [Hyphomicrobiaceae bacterium]